MASSPLEYTKKVIVIGDSAVGKTSFIARVTEGRFISDHKATIGVDCAVKSIKRGESTTIRLALWDIGGQEAFRGLMPQFARGSSGIIIVCDVTRKATVDAVRIWKNEADKVLTKLPPCILLVNKFDLPKHIHSVSIEELDTLTEECKLSGWFQTSVKENVNLQVSLEDLSDLMVQFDEGSLQDNDTITTLQRQYHAEKRNCMCD
ncbi:PREDICTED: ras-related protein Rab-7L1-like [Amphimedon queenslandica]|uniref:GTP-binding protein n=1 Tax=Amphimedon queenslandica TaxID=400682 RepID=A0A1X7VTJ4_AMPQE|nr:PREDICTED: ras-related protein Rab-7L1-like [Amphimedon queenslandica]|eukprot:XP_011405994.1 PREDICTED: ras-related protein Rab-7L1-like [Amphimedon queenslandica]